MFRPHLVHLFIVSESWCVFIMVTLALDSCSSGLVLDDLWSLEDNF